MKFLFVWEFMSVQSILGTSLDSAVLGDIFVNTFLCHALLINTKRNLYLNRILSITKLMMGPSILY